MKLLRNSVADGQLLQLDRAAGRHLLQLDSVELVRLVTLCRVQPATALGVDQFARELSQLYDDHAGEPPLVLTGPGGDFQRGWPAQPDRYTRRALLAEQLGGSPEQAIAEAMPH